MSNVRHASSVIAIVLFASTPAFATEICGNGIDDDGNGLTDEGCYPTLTSGVCESPLSCDDTGAVSWLTGSLHYTLPPDIAPHVPYGPGIGFRRIYTSMYTPGATPTSVNKTPLGPGWQHNYLTWVNPAVPGTISYATWHRVDGRDVLFTKTSTDGHYDYYTPQAGDHVLSFKVDITTGPFYYIQLLTGETLKYNAVGQLIEIWDTLPTPNKVLITWDSTTNGNVSTVTDASGKHRLFFTYTGGHLTSTQLQHFVAVGFPWSTDHTTSYSYYSSLVSRDATSGWYVPANATEWANLLVGSGIPGPTTAWGCQDLLVALHAIVGTIGLGYNDPDGEITWHATVSGWSRFAVSLMDGSISNFQSTSSLCNPATTKCSMFAIIATGPNGVGLSVRDVMGMGDTNGAVAGMENTGRGGTTLLPREWWRGGFANESGALTTGVHPWILSTDPTASTTSLFTDVGSATPTWNTGTSVNGNVTLGDLRTSAQPTSYLYAAQWTGTALTATQSATLFDRIKNGNQLLASVTIGGVLAQQYTYGAANLLTLIQDTTSQLVSFSYSSTTTGRVNQVSTPDGTLGFDFVSSRTACSGKTLLYFNQGNTTSCATDTDCGTGYMCGGQTGVGATGSCYRAARCLTLSTTSGESVVTGVSSIGPGGGSCTGACAKIMSHVWSSVTGFVNQIGLEDGVAGYTSMALCTTTGSGCTASYPYQIGYGDTDTDPTNGGWNRTVWLYYDTTFPGRISEIRRPSSVSSNASSCSYTNSLGCDQTLYFYGAVTGTSCLVDNQLCTTRHFGYNLDSSGNPVASPTFVDKTVVHDSLGRVIEADGPGSTKTLLHYYLSTDTYADEVKDQVSSVDASNTLTTQYLTYDLHFGLPATIKSPNGMLTCQTYDPSFGYVASSRIPMAGQTDCTTTNGADLTTSAVIDTWLTYKRGSAATRKLGATKQLTRPDGSCVITTIDSKHRVSQILRRDDCLSSSGGDYEQYQYTADGQVSEIDTYDSTSTIRAKQLFTYFDGGQLQQIVNPANPSTFEALTYDLGGRLTEVDGEANLTKSIFHYDGAPGRDSRRTSIERYKNTSSSDTWAFLYSWAGFQIQVTDGDSKITGTVYDDFGHLTKLTTPDLAGPTLGLYSSAGNLTTVIEDLGGGANQQVHTYSYDFVNRPLITDDAGSCTTSGTAHAEIQRSYDSLPSGVTCPMAGGCNHLQGHVAYVETILMCDGNSTDGSLDQFTFYSYDAANRLVEEYIKDDTGRTADQTYAYTKNGALASVTMPSGASLSWGYGSSGNNSDTDLITSVSRSGTAVVDTVEWFPFGPLQQYNQKNTLSSTPVQTSMTRDLAYRITDVKQKAGSATLLDTTLNLDPHGRVTARLYAGAAGGVQSSYFLYDAQDRVTCETTDLQSTCPTSGTDIKNTHSLFPPFTNAGDWKRVLRPIAGSSGGLTNDINTSGTLYGSSHRITDVNQIDGTPAFGHTAFGYDSRASRSSDDNTTSLAHDGRTYTYDGRRNLRNVRGEYYTGAVWHFYDVASAFDAFNRRVFKSFYDETTLKTATWFFYYDPDNRLTEVLYTPDISAASTYSVFQLIWLRDRLVAYWQTDYPTATTSKRYVGTDEAGRPIDMWNWPTSGDTTRVWAISPDAWGNDHSITGINVFQPIMFAGQYQDRETAAYENDGATVHRPGLVLNGFRTYDPFTGGYLQIDHLVDQSLSSYGYAGSNPVSNADPSGLRTNLGCESVCEGADDVDGCIFLCQAGDGGAGNWSDGDSSGVGDGGDGNSSSSLGNAWSPSDDDPCSINPMDPVCLVVNGGMWLADDPCWNYSSADPNGDPVCAVLYGAFDQFINSQPTPVSPVQFSGGSGTYSVDGVDTSGLFDNRP